MERLLRAARPAPPRTLVDAIVARAGKGSNVPRRRMRVGVVAAVAALVAAALGATGGFGVAAAGITSMTGSVFHSGTQDAVAPSASLASFTGSSQPRFDSACSQYAVPPTITDVDPLVGAPGTLVTVHGTNFTGTNLVSDVELGAQAATFRVDSSTTLEFVVPDGAVSARITVSNCAGPIASTDSFTVETSPAITNVSPASAGIGAAVTITGTGFLGTTKVTFNGKADTGFSVGDGGTTIAAHVPVGAPVKAGTVSVTNGVGSVSASFTVEPGAPTISKLTPTAGQVGQAAPITINGSNFADSQGAGLVSHVYFSGASGPVAAAFSVVSKSEVDAATVPRGAITGPVTVETSIGAATSKQIFTVVGATPVVDSFSPDAAKVGAKITLQGSSLLGVSEVDFTDGNGNQTIAGGSVSVVDDSTVTVTVPSGARTGVVKVTRHTDGADQTGTSSAELTVLSEAPQLQSVSPTSGGYGTRVTIAAVAGHTLKGVTSVAFNGTADTTFSIAADGASITATVPPKARALAVGDGEISVRNAVGTTSIPFDVLSFGPTISKVIGTLGRGDEAQVGDPITILGANLDSVTSVTFGGRRSTSSFVWQDDNLLTVRVPTGATTGPITVTNPEGEATSATSLTILVQPTIVGFSPAFGRAGTKVTIVGDGLAGATGVYFGGAPARFGVNEDGSIGATVPANASTGSVEVVVGRVLSADSGNDVFTVVATKPAVSAFSPGSDAVGTSVTITGRQFVGPLTVKFGSRTASVVHVSSSTSLTARVPDGAAGTVAVSVSNLAGTGAKSGFEVVSVGRATPAVGVRETTKVRITGSNLTARGAPSVQFNGTAVPSSDVVSTSRTRIVVRVPAGATTGSISVSTGPLTVTAPKSFTVIVPPSIRSMPATSQVGTWIVIDGAGFTGVSSVRFGTATARFTVVDDGHLRVLVPRTGAQHLSVRNAAATTVSIGMLTATR